jgi:predicted alpha/beta hydrolase
MCFQLDALPPDLPAGRALPRVAGGAAAESLTLESADGTRFAAALAESPQGGETGVVVLPDVRGLYRFYVELAERFAEAGHHAIAIDYFGRSAGIGERGEDFEHWPHVAQVESANVQADVAAAIAALRERTGVGGRVLRDAAGQALRARLPPLPPARGRGDPGAGAGAVRRRRRGDPTRRRARRGLCRRLGTGARLPRPDAGRERRVSVMHTPRWTA